MERLDWLLAKQPDKIKEPAAYLVQAIKNDFAAPKRFASDAERQRRQEAQRVKERQAADDRRRMHEEDRREADVRKAADAQIARLNKAERALLEAELLAQASPEDRQTIQDPSLRMFRDTLMLGMLRKHFAEKQKAGRVLAEA
jgi:hypothetical protein